MDKNVRPYEDILPLRVKMNVFVTSIDSIKETTMDFGLTFILRYSKTPRKKKIIILKEWSGKIRG